MFMRRIKVLLVSFSLIAAVAVSVGPASAQQPVGFVPTPGDFVVQQYEDFLSRTPEAGGLSYWTGLLEGGVSGSALVQELALSPEFQGTVAPVVRLYYAHLLRAPQYDGITYWAGVVRDGATIVQVSDEFVLSQEFQNRYGELSDAEYVNLVYENVLGRPADDEGLAYWIDLMDKGLSRGAVMASFSDSVEYRNTIDSRVLATMLYVGMLRRSPDPSGLDYWASVIANGVPYAAVIAGFLDSAEYGLRMDSIYVERHPLSGVATRSAATQPALAVKIDNHNNARPQKNIDQADIIYEEMVEYNLTRLIAVFHSDIPDVIGPVRSIRTSDIDILAQLNTPLLAASGANSGVLAAVAAADLVNVNAIVAGSAYFRDTNLSAPHNLFARTDDLYEFADGRGGTPPALFTYRDRGEAPLGGVPAVGVNINFGRTVADFIWDPARQGWARLQDGTPHVTQTGLQLAPENVVVLEMVYGTSPADAQSPEVESIGTGNAYIFTDGQIVFGTWSRSAATDPIVILDGDSVPIALTPGLTMVELAPTATITIR